MTHANDPATPAAPARALNQPTTGAAPPHHAGQCLCGGIRYELHARIQAVTHCHCQMCQRAHGAAFASYGAVRQADFHIVKGAALLRQYASSPGVLRSFCSHCGSPLTWQRAEGEFSDWLSFSLGSLSTAFVPHKQRHAHLSAAPGWCPGAWA